MTVLNIVTISIDFYTRPQSIYALLIKVWEPKMDSTRKKKDWEVYFSDHMALTNDTFDFKHLQTRVTFKVETQFQKT